LAAQLTDTIYLATYVATAKSL